MFFGYSLTGGKNLNGYVFSFSVRGGTRAFKECVLEENGYVGSHGKPVGEDEEFKIKYLFDYRSEVSDAIGSALEIDFTRKRLQLAEVKNILAKCKK